MHGEARETIRRDRSDTAAVGGGVAILGALALFGGSRFQMAGPTGAFVPVLFAIVGVYGYDGLALATLMAGAVLVLIGVLRMGRLLKFTPYPVIAGFTSGIALIIFCGQLNEFLGLGLKMPGHAPQQIAILAHNIHLLDPRALGIGAITLAVYYGWPWLTRKIPASIVAVTGATAVAYFSGWPIATIGTRFGEFVRWADMTDGLRNSDRGLNRCRGWENGVSF